jgi:hypothetical protein
MGSDELPAVASAESRHTCDGVAVRRDEYQAVATRFDDESPFVDETMVVFAQLD